MSNPLTDARSVARRRSALLRRVGHGFVLAIMLTPTRVPAQQVGPARVTPPPLQQLPELPASRRYAAPRGDPRRAAAPGTAAGHPDRARAPGPAGPDPAREARPLVRPAVPDSTGLVPNRPSVNAVPRPPGEVTRQMSDLIEFIQDPEAEINVVVGRSKLIQTRQAVDPDRDRQPGGRRHRLHRRSARSPRVQPLRPVVRHHEPDALGRGRTGRSRSWSG